MGLPGAAASPKRRLGDEQVTRSNTNLTKQQQHGGAGRHGAEDGRFGLPDAPPGGRGAGRHRDRKRLRHQRRHLRRADHRIRRNHRAVARPHRGPRGARRPEGLRRQPDRRRQPGDHRGPGGGHSGGRHRARQDPLRADLRIQARRVRGVLRPQPGHRPAGGARRSGGRDRGAIHRRARHAVDHAHLPHRRNGHPHQRAIHAGRQVRRFRALHRHPDGAQQDGRADRHEPQRHHGGGGRQGPREGTLPGGLRRARAGGRRRSGEEPTRSCSSGIRTPSRS